MDILQIVGLGIIATILIVVLKAQRPELAIQISIITGIVIFILIVNKLSAVLNLLTGFANRAHIDMSYMGLLLKIIGIAYISEFGAEVCKDAGEGSIASKIELAGKVTVIILAVPIVTSLLNLIIKIMP